MLKNIPKIVSPELLKILCEMGHGDEIVIADANFPSQNLGKKVIRAEGIGGNEMLKAVLQLIPLDTYADQSVFLMETVYGDPVPYIWDDYKATLAETAEKWELQKLERFAFYDRAKNAYAVIATGESQIYANIILKKGIIK